MSQIPSEKKAPPPGGEGAAPADAGSGLPAEAGSAGKRPEPASTTEAASTAPAAIADSTEELARMAASRILIIDDNVQNLEVLVAYLDTLGGQVRTARSGAEGLGMVRAEAPDLILLDVMMPQMSGFEVCRKLKSDPGTRDIPVLMVTALTEMNDIEQGVKSGTDDFISKPVNRLELLTRVRSLLRVRHLKDELERTLAYLSDVETRVAPGRQ